MLFWWGIHILLLSLSLPYIARSHWQATHASHKNLYHFPSCGSLSEDAPWEYMFDYFVPIWKYLEKVRRCGIVEGMCVTGVGFWASKELSHSLCPLFASCLWIKICYFSCSCPCAFAHLTWTFWNNTLVLIKVAFVKILCHSNRNETKIPSFLMGSGAACLWSHFNQHHSPIQSVCDFYLLNHTANVTY